MLVVEGPDGAGKTTLCHKLISRLNDEYGFPHTYSHLSKPENRFDQYWGYVEMMRPHVVQDRFHLGELVYQQLRGEERLDFETYKMVTAKFRLMGGFMVLILPSSSLIRERWNSDQKFDLIKTIVSGTLFEDMLANSGIAGDIDYYFKSTEVDPYVTDRAIDSILDGYLIRSRCIQTIAERRPASL